MMVIDSLHVVLIKIGTDWSGLGTYEDRGRGGQCLRFSGEGNTVLWIQDEGIISTTRVSILIFADIVYLFCTYHEEDNFTPGAISHSCPFSPSFTLLT